MSLIPIPKPPKVKVKTKKNKGILNANVVVNALATPPDTFYAGEKLKKAYKDQDTLQRVIAMRVKLPYDGKFLI